MSEHTGPGGQLSLFDAAVPPAAAAAPDPDADARAYAVDPRHNVVLEASAGTGKTSVLVARYVNLLRGGVDPANILAITFTRKAAAEMRERIVRELRAAAERSEADRRRWRELRDRIGEIAISTIDAFCLAMLREFPLEADVDPGFDLADETEVPRLIGTALDRAMRILAGIARTDDDVALVLAQLGIARTRDGLTMLLDRRLVARDALDRFLARGPRHLTAARACREALDALAGTLRTVRGGLPSFLSDGPSGHPRFTLLVREIDRLEGLSGAPEAAVRAALERVAGHFLTNEATARKPGTAVHPYKAEHYPSKDAARRHRDALFDLAPQIERVMFAFNRDLNVVMARGIRRMFAVALTEYRRALEERSLLDFSDVLERALELLRRMDEFSQSRYRLESRFHHVLVDEFQDTSRAQWELVSLLVQAWGEGQGLAAAPSIFIVGDRKQSIYRFRDAEVAVLQEAAQYIDGLRPGSRARRSIARSFRAVPELLQFVNDVFSEISQPPAAAGDFSYDERDRFPVDPAAAGRSSPEPALGLAVAESPDACAAAVADEIVRILGAVTVRDKATGLARPARPGDIAILFRSRSSHREFERELGSRSIPTYVYKGLGFFDADEIKDLTALLRYLAEPSSPLRAAALLRSRFIRLSDRGLAALAPDLAAALLDDVPAARALDEEDRRVLAHARPAVRRWLADADRVTPAELLDRILAGTAYAFELAGMRRRQAWENVKKFRGLVRRIQNRGYATLPRIAAHLTSLGAGDESNAVVEALDAVNLMTVHASKGLEFPIVFLVNLAKGAGGPPQPVRVAAGGDGGGDAASVTVGPFLSDTDDAERERERHETRRLLYVALTRARDRIYLASLLKDGRFAAGRGSLGDVLPPSLKALFERASSTFSEVDTLGWEGMSGHEYLWRLCRPPAGAPADTSDAGKAIAQENVEGARADDDFAPPAAPPPRRRLGVTTLSAGPVDDAIEEPVAPRSDALLGTVLHRLFALDVPKTSAVQPDEAAGLVDRVLREDERAVIEDVGAFAVRAARTWSAVRDRPDVRSALDGVERSYEVPFSLSMGGEGQAAVVRGTIDCLVRKADGRLLVLEFKTGRRRVAHERQLELYMRAARAIWSGAIVDGLLVYL